MQHACHSFIYLIFLVFPLLCLSFPLSFFLPEGGAHERLLVAQRQSLHDLGRLFASHLDQRSYAGRKEGLHTPYSLDGWMNLFYQHHLHYMLPTSCLLLLSLSSSSPSSFSKVDGGYMNVLPADVMAKLGADTIIAVDVAGQVSSSSLSSCRYWSSRSVLFKYAGLVRSIYRLCWVVMTSPSTSSWQFDNDFVIISSTNSQDTSAGFNNSSSFVLFLSLFRTLLALVSSTMARV
jgi:hypothetical protein